ncbi:rhomboid family intramembrane serine protease [Rhodococcoides corynebacterioides]|uniref:Rhomboid family intramembrane serine protease n=1 Tax=Rhodococcoides corynebacterioides TaxID=53972 RepID=A0ABS7P7D2_9NOCA|nr:rhomboid family intramembrane serine protease [Rhodococcus corynebacterioides]MBY6368288.1 rhomboid family intramembrane serine protease [Rhodococcus corynebacterioides]MBY6409058.1 rhomboid family intramembrane serine protease [Rhodococcus corynebacterioides]
MSVPPTRTPSTTPSGARSRWSAAAVGILGFLALLYVVEAVDVASGMRLDNAGIRPRDVDGLSGVAFAPVLHDGWDHLFANTGPLLVLGFVLLLSGVGRALAVTAVIWIVGGLGTWLTGASGSIHIGASILVFGWLAYLIVRGVFARDIGQMALGFVVLVVYGGLLWGVLPTEERVSWQGHLFGALAGVLAAWMFASRRRPSDPSRALSPHSR